MKPIKYIYRAVKNDIWDTEYTARIYKDKITVDVPYTRWRDTEGMLQFAKQTIDNSAIAARILMYLSDVNDDNRYDKAWDLIGRELDIDYLRAWADDFPMRSEYAQLHKQGEI